MRKYYLLVIVTGIITMTLFSCTKRQPEEIAYAPNLPFNPYPADSATNIDHTTLDVTLNWRATDPNSGDVLTYDLYFDTLNPPITQIASGLSAPSYFVDSLSYNTMYYWKVFVKDQLGTTTASPVWSFSTLPHANQAPRVPVYLAPADGAAWQYPTLNFKWSSSDPDWGDTIYYALYLGNTPVPPALCSPGYTDTCYEQTGLAYSTKYYWKVLVRDNHWAVTEGPVYSFTTRTSPWFYKSSLPTPRYGFGTAVVNDKIYLMGGKDPSENVLSLVEEYDPLSDTWTQKADMPTPRYEATTAIYNNTIYVFGGSTNKVEEYDPQTNVWSVKNDAPGRIGFAVATAFHNKIYVGRSVYDPVMDDWWDTTYVETYTFEDTTYYDTIYTWAKLNYPNSNPVILNNELYFLNVEGIFGGGFWSYNESLDTCLYLHAVTPPYSADSFRTVVANNCLYMLGGYNNGCYTGRVSKYDPFADTWYIRSDMQTARSTFGTAYVNNCIYVFGGLNVLWLSSVEEYRLLEDPKNIPYR